MKHKLAGGGNLACFVVFNLSALNLILLDLAMVIATRNETQKVKGGKRSAICLFSILYLSKISSIIKLYFIFTEVNLCIFYVL